MTNIKLKIKNISKSYFDSDNKVEVIDNLNIDIYENRFVCILGPSGCGKSTLLRIISGLMKPTKGEVILNDTQVTQPMIKCGLVPQSYTLFPWLTVWNNIRFGLKHKKINDENMKSIIQEYLELIGLLDYKDYYPKELSGGMQQRVAIARTLAVDPELLLMDEPFGALDSQTRIQMQEFILKIWEAKKKTVIFVTHDIDEAIFLADEIFILSSKPATIKDKIIVDIARPRTCELLISLEFLKIKQKIFNLIKEEVRID